RPSLARSWSRSFWSRYTFWPLAKRISTTSPGSTRRRTNTKTATPSSVGIIRRRRFTKYRAMPGQPGRVPPGAGGGPARRVGAPVAPAPRADGRAAWRPHPPARRARLPPAPRGRGARRRTGLVPGALALPAGAAPGGRPGSGPPARARATARAGRPGSGPAGGGLRRPAAPPRPGPGGRGRLLGEPHRVELVVQVVARGDLPALHLAAVHHDPVPLERHQVVRLLVEEPLLELPDQLLPLLGVARPGLPVVQLVQHPVGVPAVVGRVLVGREELVHVQVRLDDVPALEVGGELEVARPERVVVRGRLDHLLLDRHPDLSPLVDEPDRQRLVRHRRPAVRVGEREILGAGLLEEAPRLRPRGGDVVAVPGELLQLGRRRRVGGAGHLDPGDLLHD